MPVMRDERGFTMVTVIAAMLIAMMLAGGALAAAQGDLKPGQHDKDRKEAYAAAEAGLQSYLFHLTQDNGYWTKCTGVAAPSAVNQAWGGAGNDPRLWLRLPGSQARYTLELLPANGATTCDAAAPVSSMIDTATGTFRIRATGMDRAGGTKRSIIANFRRRGLIDYVYFTDKETVDPEVYSVLAGGSGGTTFQTQENPRGSGQTQRDVRQWAREECGTRYWGDTRSNGGRGASTVLFSGSASNGAGRKIGSTWSDMTTRCQEIQFAPTDVVRGPLHTNDEILVCSNPIFGRAPDDNIETSGPGRAPSSDAESATMGWRGNANAPCTSSKPSVNFKGQAVNGSLGTWIPSAPVVKPPPDNSELKKETPSTYRWMGRTTIVLNGAQMTVTGRREGASSSTTETVAIPTDGSVYVSEDTARGCGTTYDPINANAAPAGCGNLEISGTYSRNVTFGAQQDIIVTGNLRRNGDYLLGLISNNFVRVAHPVTASESSTTVSRPTWSSTYKVMVCDNANANADLSIDAAILSLSHSFIVDNYYCGDQIGTLNVTGAIAQAYRGPVGKTNSFQSNGQTYTLVSGYVKNYKYDDRLRFRSPPRFLDPVQASWRIQTFAEQVPSR